MYATVLCIEDNPDNALILESILTKAGYTTYIARDGDSGLQLAEQHQPDLIVCDFHLPGDNAPEVIRKIRHIDQLHDVPVVILTADPRSGPESQAIGIVGYLNKPIKPQELITTIQQLV